MENQTVNISEMDVTQLKALAFDLIKERDLINLNLSAVNEEINKKIQPLPAVAKKKRSYGKRVKVEEISPASEVSQDESK